MQQFLYHFNLATTLTKTEEEIMIEDNREIDYSNSISLYHLVESFNKMYLLFKKDYEKLDKLDLGEKVEFLDFYKSENSDYQCLMMYIYNPNKEICDNDIDTILYIYKDNDEIYSTVTNNINPYDDEFYNNEINLDKEKVKAYLDFAEKYKLFFKCYRELKDKFIFGNGTTVLFSKINGDLLQNISSFELSFGNVFFNTSDNIEVIFKIGENLDYLYDQCKLEYDFEEHIPTKEKLDTLVNGIYINRTKLPEFYQKEKTKHLIKEKR